MPKIVPVQVFAFNELSEKAQDKAHYEFLSAGFEYAWSSENRDTIESFCDLFGIDLQNWSIDSCSYSYDATIPQQRSITKKQAVAMVDQWSEKDGYCLCYDAKQAMNDANNWRYGDLTYVLDQCLDSMFRVCRDDYSHQSSIEYFVESCEANDWMFFESGELFHA